MLSELCGRVLFLGHSVVSVACVCVRRRSVVSALAPKLLDRGYGSLLDRLLNQVRPKLHVTILCAAQGDTTACLHVICMQPAGVA
jgi:hypothetical protein